jgi:hypothetical protein
MTANAAHPDLAAERWHTMPLVAQLANVGSEVERAIRAHEQSNTKRWTSAFARALELFDLTATDARWRGHRRREILRARELFCGLFYATAPAAGDAAFLRKYFLEFAMAARR